MKRIESMAQVPELDEKQVHIWGVHVPDQLDQLDRLKQMLNPQEWDRADRFRRPADRASSICARAALRILLGTYSEVRPEELIFSYSENGKPHGPDLRRSFNVSHSGDWVVLAFGKDRQVGVDIEQIRRDRAVLRVAARWFSKTEHQLVRDADDPHAVFFQIWARREAYIKACGSALFRESGRFSVPIDNGALPDEAEQDGWVFHRLEAGSKYAAALVTDRPLEAVPCYDFNGLELS